MKNLVVRLTMALALAISFGGTPTMAASVGGVGGTGGGGSGGGGSTCVQCKCQARYMALTTCFCPASSWGGIKCHFSQDSIGNKTCFLEYGPCPPAGGAFPW